MLNNNVKAENGYVVLPIEEYNKLIVLQTTVNNMIKLEENYDKQVAVSVDSTYVYKVATQMYKTSEFNTPERELIAGNNFSVWSSALTRKVVTEDED